MIELLQNNTKALSVRAFASGNYLRVFNISKNMQVLTRRFGRHLLNKMESGPLLFDEKRKMEYRGQPLDVLVSVNNNVKIVSKRNGIFVSLNPGKSYTSLFKDAPADLKTSIKEREENSDRMRSNKNRRYFGGK